MSRSITSGALAIVLAGLAPLPFATAHAQDDAGMDTRSAITVTAPHARQTGRAASGAPIETMEAQSIVYYDDLDLRTEAGRNELGKRVDAAAESACKWIDEVFPPNATTTPATMGDCKREAVKRAKSQVDQVLAMGN